MLWTAFLLLRECGFQLLVLPLHPRISSYTFVNHTLSKVILASGLDIFSGLEKNRSDFTGNMAISYDSNTYCGHKVEKSVQFYLDWETDFPEITSLHMVTPFP